MQEITTVVLDLAKNVFHQIGCNEHGKEVMRKMLKRAQVRAYFANLPPCLIGMEPVPAPITWLSSAREPHSATLPAGDCHLDRLRT